MNRITATCIAGMRSKTTTGIKTHFQRRKKPRGRSLLRGFGLGIFAKRLRWRPSATRRDDGQLDARDRPRVALCRRLFGNDLRADRHHGARDQPRVREAVRRAWPRQPRGRYCARRAVSFLSKLITDKAETPIAETPATVVPVAKAFGV